MEKEGRLMRARRAEARDDGVFDDVEELMDGTAAGLANEEEGGVVVLPLPFERGKGVFAAVEAVSAAAAASVAAAANELGSPAAVAAATPDDSPLPVVAFATVAARGASFEG